MTRERLKAAPCYDSRRCESLRQRGYLWCPEPGYLDTAARTYALTDRGRAAVEARRSGTPLAAIQSELSQMNEDMRHERAEQKAEKAKDRRFQFFNALISAVAGAIVTLLIEHFPEIVSLVRLRLS